MKAVIILIFVLIVSILYVVVQRYKQEERDRIEKSKELVQNIIDKIPKKMQLFSSDYDPSNPVHIVVIEVY